MNREGRCVHYNGCGRHDVCEAGVNYEQLAGGRVGMLNRLPCLTNDYHDGAKRDTSEHVVCEHRRFPTAEEVEASRREIDLLHNGMRVAREAIVKSIGGPWKRGMMGVSGSVDCPVCKGEQSLKFSRAGINGHIHAACKTKDCVAWME